MGKKISAAKRKRQYLVEHFPRYGKYDSELNFLGKLRVPIIAMISIGPIAGIWLAGIWLNGSYNRNYSNPSVKAWVMLILGSILAPILAYSGIKDLFSEDRIRTIMFLCVYAVSGVFGVYVAIRMLMVLPDNAIVTVAVTGGWLVSMAGILWKTTGWLNWNKWIGYRCPGCHKRGNIFTKDVCDTVYFLRNKLDHSTGELRVVNDSHTRMILQCSACGFTWKTR